MSAPTNPKSTNQYQLPCMIRSKMSAPVRGAWLCLFFTIVTIIVSPWIVKLIPTDSVRVIWLRPFGETMFFLFVSLFILSYWLYTDVFRRAYIFMDENSLHLKFFLRRKKQIPWEEIGLIDMVQPIRTCPWSPPYGLEKAKVGKGSEVRIILRQSKENGKKMRRFPKAYIISIANFSELDCYRFLNTVGEQMEKASKRR